MSSTASYNFIFPGEPAAKTLYRDGTFILSLSGGGAIRVKNSEITEQLVKGNLITAKDVANSHILFQREGTQRLLYIKTGYKYCKPELDTGTLQFSLGANAKGEIQHVRVDISNAQNPKTKFAIDWVPLTVPKKAVEAMANSFCNNAAVTQDSRTPSKYWVSTTTEAEDIPFFIYTLNMIATDTNTRVLKVSIIGREQKCEHCEGDHKSHTCRGKNEGERILQGYYNQWRRNQQEASVERGLRAARGSAKTVDQERQNAQKDKRKLNEKVEATARAKAKSDASEAKKLKEAARKRKKEEENKRLEDRSRSVKTYSVQVEQNSPRSMSKYHNNLRIERNKLYGATQEAFEDACGVRSDFDWERESNCGSLVDDLHLSEDSFLASPGTLTPLIGSPAGPTTSSPKATSHDAQAPPLENSINLVDPTQLTQQELVIEGNRIQLAQHQRRVQILKAATKARASAEATKEGTPEQRVTPKRTCSDGAINGKRAKRPKATNISKSLFRKDVPVTTGSPKRHSLIRTGTPFPKTDVEVSGTPQSPTTMEGPSPAPKVIPLERTSTEADQPDPLQDLSHMSTPLTNEGSLSPGSRAVPIGGPVPEGSLLDQPGHEPSIWSLQLSLPETPARKMRGESLSGSPEGDKLRWDAQYDMGSSTALPNPPTDQADDDLYPATQESGYNCNITSDNLTSSAAQEEDNRDLLT